MSNKGNHGDGEKANTETPLVCWGAGRKEKCTFHSTDSLSGIDTPRMRDRSFSEDKPITNSDVDRNKRIRTYNEKTPSGWKLDNLVRRYVGLPLLS